MTGRRKLDLSEVVVYTVDDALVSITAVVQFEVVDPARAAREFFDLNAAVEMVGVTVLRNSAGERPLEQLLSGPAEFDSILTDQANGWLTDRGVTVTRIDIVEISPSSIEAFRANVAARLRQHDFSTVLWGYDRGQVDELLRRLGDAVASDAADRRTAAAQALREPLRSRFRGYDRAQVDSFLAHMPRLVAEL